VTDVTRWGAPRHRQMGIEGVNIKELAEARGNAAGRNVARVFSMKSECTQAAEIGHIPLLGPEPRRPKRAAERREL
jgi:hypothetical protein